MVGSDVVMIVPSSAERNENRHRTKKIQNMSHEALKSAGASMWTIPSSFLFSIGCVVTDASVAFDDERDVSISEFETMLGCKLLLSTLNLHAG
jgi:hypothetical protein